MHEPKLAEDTERSASDRDRARGRAPAHSLYELQQTVGNHAVARLLASHEPGRPHPLQVATASAVGNKAVAPKDGAIA